MINIISILESLEKKKDSFKKLNEERKNNKELDSYLIDYRIISNSKLIINTKHNIKYSYQSESEILGLILLMEHIIKFIEVSKEYEKVMNNKLSKLRKKEKKEKKDPGE